MVVQNTRLEGAEDQGEEGRLSGQEEEEDVEREEEVEEEEEGPEEAELELAR